MGQHDSYDINRLIGKLTDLQEQWESNPDAFDWTALQALAQEGALAYNEEAGPSFHALALGGAQYNEFHERFLEYSLQAGFDPFKLASAGSGSTQVPVIDHAGLADEALSNPSAARMQASLMNIARARFEPLAQEAHDGAPAASAALFQVFEACVESIPADLLERIAPELAKSHPEAAGRQTAPPIDGYLTAAEAISDNARPHG